MPFRRALIGRTLSLIAAVSMSVATAHAAEPRDPSPSDPDFQVQGEYAGTVVTPEGQKAIGVQVIALGGHKFQAVGYIGGLPGAGWDHGPLKNAEGETKGEVTEFKAIDHSGAIKDGVLTITVIGGIKLGELSKVNRESPTLGAKPPAGAVVLFDGSNADGFDGGRITEDGLLLQGATSRQKFQSGSLHIEFRLPFQPEARGQGRGNSGCYLQGRYEVQVLDSFGLEGRDNECGGIYSIKAPDVNMCLPPGAWQTYDIDFTAGKFDGDKKVADPKITVKHNGVLIQNDVALPHTTTAAPVGEGPQPGPVYLQDHGNPVRYRNIWFVERP